MSTKHPAPYHKAVCATLRQWLRENPDYYPQEPDGARPRLLDPFCGSGRIADLADLYTCYGIEIEAEWADQARRRGLAEVWTGRAEDVLAAWAGQRRFHAICTSPCYGNRLADQYAPDLQAPKHRLRRTYRLALGHALAEGSLAALQWTNEGFRTQHACILERGVEVLLPGGLFFLNVKNHRREHRLQLVSEWFLQLLLDLGLELLDTRKLVAPGDQNTNTMRSRGVRGPEFEWLFFLRKPPAGDAGGPP
jgi:hypothetical protein